MIKSISRFRRLFALALLGSMAMFPTETSAQKTNIILLFSDDAGYHDLGFQGSKTFKTPNLDRLAAEGMVFRQAYTTAAVCGPSRGGLLTGIYQQRFGYEENNVPGYMSASSRLMGNETGLPTNMKTIADYLKPMIYTSIILGKWHLGNADRYHPLRRGFDKFYGFRGGARSFFPLTQKEVHDRPENRLEQGFKNYEEPEKYLTDDLADAACDFMARNQEKPFFMYMSFNAVHTPLQATEADLKKVQGLEGKRKVLAAMTIAMDRACGQILDKLKELGLEDDIGEKENLAYRYPERVGEMYKMLFAWDGIWDQKEVVGAYQHKTYVLQSDDPMVFGNDTEKMITTLNGHAPEIFRDEDGDWYISSAEWPERGVSVDKLIWE